MLFLYRHGSKLPQEVWGRPRNCILILWGQILALATKPSLLQITRDVSYLSHVWTVCSFRIICLKVPKLVCFKGWLGSIVTSDFSRSSDDDFPTHSSRLSTIWIRAVETPVSLVILLVSQETSTVVSYCGETLIENSIIEKTVNCCCIWCFQASSNKSQSCLFSQIQY